jgi:hypothetical protein
MRGMMVMDIHSIWMICGGIIEPMCLWGHVGVYDPKILVSVY